jgi:ketosteroid isomerase-like protein
MRQRILRDPPLQKPSYERKNRMKLLTSFLALTALSLATSAFAQDESPSPAAPADQKASATVEASPEATKSSSTAEESPAATSSAAEKTEQPSGSVTPGAKKKETATSSESKKAAAEPAAKPGKKMSVEAAIKDNENRWEAGIASHDASFVQLAVADDFMGVHSDGKVQNKSAVIAEFKKDKDTYKSAKNEKLIVRTYGPSVAVVVGASREKGTGKDGKAFDRTFRFTDTWVDRNGQWQCVASQIMLVPKK